MVYDTQPESLYDEVTGDKDHVEHNGETIPISNSAIETVAEKEGEEQVELMGPHESFTITGDGTVPGREQLLDELLAAQRTFNNRPVFTLTNLYGGSIAPLHYSDSTAHFLVTADALEARPQRAGRSIPDAFQTIGVKAAHIAEGVRLSRGLSHHWFDDVGWMDPRFPQNNPADGAESKESCFIINVPSAFPAQSFGQATTAPAKLVNQAISKTERTLDKTLLTQRMAQLTAVENACIALEGDADPDNLDGVIMDTFHISESGLASLRSQMNTRRDEAFETVRELSDCDDFNYVMEEYAETIDELGELAVLGSKYREEVLGEPPGFW